MRVCVCAMKKCYFGATRGITAAFSPVFVKLMVAMKPLSFHLTGDESNKVDDVHFFFFLAIEAASISLSRTCVTSRTWKRSPMYLMQISWRSLPSLMSSNPIPFAVPAPLAALEY